MHQGITLKNGVEMPLLGFGVFRLKEEERISCVRTAVETGYRLFDTAAACQDEQAVGTALRQAVEDGLVKREELFLTAKLSLQDVGENRTEAAFEETLKKLQTDYVDLYLIHWPVPGCYQETWKAMEKIYASGRAKSVGVSNFEPRHLEELAKISDLVPAVNQIEFHPYYYQKATLEYCQAHGIQVQAYAPLARGAYLENDVMCVLATKYGKTPAQIGLRWSIQKGVAVIPKSTRAERIQANGDIFNFEIEPEDMEIIDSLNQNYRSANIPEDLRNIPW